MKKENTKNLELTIKEIEFLLNVLAEKPFGQVAGLIGKIQHQCNGTDER